MKIGLLGGTFDPPHIGHLVIAEEVRQTFGLAEVWFIPSAVPPHKTDKNITAEHHRLEMVKRAIASNPHFHLSRIECDHDGLSYTYDTMKILQKAYPNDVFSFIMGGDMVAYLPKWYKVDALLQMTEVIGVTRPGYTLDSAYDAYVKKVTIPAIDISSSMLREKANSGGNLHYWLPETVINYIMEQCLYE